MTKEELLEKHVALLEEKILLQEQKITDLQKDLDKELQNDVATVSLPYVGSYQPSFGGLIQGQRCAQGCDYNYTWSGIGPASCRRCGYPNPIYPSVTWQSQISSGTQQQGNWGNSVQS